MDENSDAPSLPLDGEWRFRLGESAEKSIIVPSAWEAHTSDKITDGPALYRRTFTLPETWPGATIILEAQAISFDATLRVNGQHAGAHRGMWSPFQCDVTPFIQPGENMLEIEVWKPGGRFPLREALAGFLPDVATTFGGIWQPIHLRALGGAAIRDLKIAVEGRIVKVQGHLSLKDKFPTAELMIELLDDRERSLGSASGEITQDQTAFTATIEAPSVTAWSPDTSALYWVAVILHDGPRRLARAVRRIGFRRVAVVEGRTELNSAPLHVRGVLDWGWDADRICPARSRTEVLEDFTKARALGFNLMKLCLFIPDETTFDIADEVGMLLWLEMPLWLPHATSNLRELALQEYTDIFKRLHHHPSIAILSLGCELNSQADLEFLQALHQLAREWFPNVLICDNSGSAEAYGGVTTNLSDFYDYHFYTDPHFFQPLVQHFSRSYQPAKPWIYGEFCDADTLRDFSALDPEPWWLTDPVALTRDDFLSMRDYKQRLSAAGVADQGAALTRIARGQATDIRKFIVEQVRLNSATGGYVITGWSDTPITTSGVVDDQRNLKFSPDEWRQFNADCILTIDRERRRTWTHGGDRPAYKDPFVWREDREAEFHLLLSNGAGDSESGKLTWQLNDAQGKKLAEGTRDLKAIRGAEVAEIAVLTVRAPAAPEMRPSALTLSAQLELAQSPGEKPRITQNSWNLWVVPKPHLPDILTVSGTLLDPQAFARIDPQAQILSAPDPGRCMITSELTEAVLAQVKHGQNVLLWQRQPDPRYTRSLPFWREAIHVFAEGHDFWNQLPHPGYADLRFFSVATDFALDWEKLKVLLGPEARQDFIWRRFDARTMTWADYLMEVKYGRGKLLISTLRFEGGLGCQPNSFETNPLGAWMLGVLLRTLIAER
jgi:hypothetical protein